MKRIIVSANEAGQRADRFITKMAPGLSSSLVQKYLRLKRVKVNGKPVKRDYRLVSGDTLDLYINDSYFERPNEDDAYLYITDPKLDILYEDEYIMLVLKPPGLLSHPAGDEYVNTLITHIQAYLYINNEWNPDATSSARPALCNRIDRNTGGIVISAKNAEALRIISEKIRENEIDKYYLAIVVGEPIPHTGRLTNYIFKDAKLNRVYAYDKPRVGAKNAVTDYTVISTSNGLSLVECKLITGRTHQIRSQFAAFGYPLLGDGKYGVRTGAALERERFQLLYSYKLEFVFRSSAGVLGYLNGQTYEANLDKIGFIGKYFPSLQGAGPML